MQTCKNQKRLMYTQGGHFDKNRRQTRPTVFYSKIQGF